MEETDQLDPDSHSTRHLAGTRLVHYGPLWDSALDQRNIEVDGPAAVIVCHGMGQQVRYETISSVAQAILTEARQHGAATDPVEVHLSEGNDQFVARAEIKWIDRADRKHEVHVYEAYWAPLTEGRVTYWDTVKFLLQGGWQGLWYSKAFRRANFQRWMFGAPRTMTIGSKTFIAVLCMMICVLLQVSLIGYVSLDVAHRLKDTLLNPLPQAAYDGVWRTLAALLQAWFRWLIHLFPGSDTLVDRSSLRDAAWYRAWLRLGLWLLAIAETFFVRYFLIQYVGDVAAYISPYKDSKFDELRHRIQKIGLDIGKVVYGFGPPMTTVPRYSRVVVVGHSLGSVLAYDTLNALINLDNVSGAGNLRNVARRTRALITFGSPLDKTAFIFRTQSNQPQDHIREQLAASVQPLIVSYKLFRPSTFKWVNIWSKRDIISGELNYYDDPDPLAKDRRPIENMIDPEASTPLVAHTQYWTNKMLREQIYRYVSHI